MAEGGVIEYTCDLVTCALCMEVYTNPVALPCLHTFCFSCLEQLLEKTSIKNILKCPLCQENHTVSEKGISSFRLNFHVGSLIDKMRKTQKPGPEGDGKKEMEKEGDKTLDTKILCSIHSDEEIRYFCKKASCREELCERCWTDKHENHIVVPLSHMLGKEMGNLEKDLEIYGTKLKSHIDSVMTYDQEISVLNDDVENTLSTLITQVEESLNKLKSARDDVITSAQAQRQKVVIQLDKAICYQEELNLLQQRLKKLRSFSQIDDIKEDIKKLVSAINGWHLFIDIPSITVTIPELENVVNVEYEQIKLGPDVDIDEKDRPTPAFLTKSKTSKKSKPPISVADLGLPTRMLSASYKDWKKSCLEEDLKGIQQLFPDAENKRQNRPRAVHETTWKLETDFTWKEICVSSNLPEFLLTSEQETSEQDCITIYDFTTGSILHQYKSQTGDNIDGLGTITTSWT